MGDEMLNMLPCFCVDRVHAVVSYVRDALLEHNI